MLTTISVFRSLLDWLYSPEKDLLVPYPVGTNLAASSLEDKKEDVGEESYS